MVQVKWQWWRKLDVNRSQISFKIEGYTLHPGVWFISLQMTETWLFRVISIAQHKVFKAQCLLTFAAAVSPQHFWMSQLSQPEPQITSPVTTQEKSVQVTCPESINKITGKKRHSPFLWTGSMRLSSPQSPFYNFPVCNKWIDLSIHTASLPTHLCIPGQQDMNPSFEQQHETVLLFKWIPPQIHTKALNDDCSYKH